MTDGARKALVLGAGAGSAALLIGALLFQYVGGLAPCQMCLWQRWPHAIALALVPLAFLLPTRLIATLGALTVFAGAAIGAFHAGVEWDWWEGITACAGAGDALTGLSGADLLSTEGPLGVIRCDEAPWVFAGLSMAGWNAVFSAALAALWLRAAWPAPDPTTQTT